MKECIACAREIEDNAKFCRDCGVQQNDSNYKSFENFDSVQAVWDSTEALEVSLASSAARKLFAKKTQSAEIIFRLAGDPDIGVRVEIADNAMAPETVQKQLAQDPEDLVRMVIAQREEAPDKVFNLLVKDEDSMVRGFLAENQSVPPEVLAALAGDDEVSVRESVAGNPSTPAEVLGTLVSDDAWTVRCKVAENQNASQASLSVLWNDREVAVRSAVARNSNVSRAALKKIFSENGYNLEEEILSDVALSKSADSELILQVLRSLVAIGDATDTHKNQEDEEEFSLNALLAQISRFRDQAQGAMESATGDNVEERQGRLDALNLVHDFMSSFDPKEMGPGSETFDEALRDFFNDHMGDTEFFEEELYDEDELEYEGAKWSTLEQVFVAIFSNELIWEE